MTSKKVKVYLFVIVSFALIAASVYAATYGQGFGTGCEIGNSETSLDQNINLYLATLDLASEAGEWDYYYGVEDGYDSCRYIAEWNDNDGSGTQCNIWGCS